MKMNMMATMNPTLPRVPMVASLTAADRMRGGKSKMGSMMMGASVGAHKFK